jgi:hypothetical protein
MPKIVNLPTSLSSKEIEEFNRICKEQGQLPAKKIGELIHGFLVVEGVKHPKKSA